MTFKIMDQYFLPDNVAVIIYFITRIESVVLHMFETICSNGVKNM